VTRQYEHSQRQEVDRAGLLKVIQHLFPEILFCNLSKGTCSTMQNTL